VVSALSTIDMILFFKRVPEYLSMDIANTLFCI